MINRRRSDSLGAPILGNESKRATMAWKIAGLIEGRSGNITVVPESFIGEHNNFNNLAEAETIKDAMNQAVLKEKTTIRYVLLPAIDDALIQQVRQLGAPQPAPRAPAISFTGPKQNPPA